MKIDNCLILSAGLGTRMGMMGECLPKVLWPIFSKKLIELQINYAKKIGAKRIFVNIHHKYDQIETFLKKIKNENVELVNEKELLDIGGAIHNLLIEKKIGVDDILLVLNGDQFLFFEEGFLEKQISRLNNRNIILIGTKVKSEKNYNRLDCENGLVKAIIKPPHLEKEHITYSGISLINLNCIKPRKGSSKFFESVANFNKMDVTLVVPENYEYLDFGTKDRYFNSMFMVFEDLIHKKSSKCLDFFQENKLFENIDITDHSIINCSKSKVENKSGERVIILDEIESSSVSCGGIYFRSMFDFVESD